MRDVIELSEVKMLVDDVISLLFTENEVDGELTYRPEYKTFIIDYCMMMYYASEIVQNEDIYSFYQKWLKGEYDIYINSFNTIQMIQISNAIDERIDMMKNRMNNHLVDSLSNLINLVNDGLDTITKFIDDVGSTDINNVMRKAHILLDDIQKEENEIAKAVAKNAIDKVETTNAETISKNNPIRIAEDNENS